MVASEQRDEQFSDEYRQMWERLESELEPLLQGGAAHQAEQRLTATLETMGEAPETAGLRARILARRAECWLELDESSTALDDARKSLELGYRSGETLGIAGWASYQLDRPGRAREYFDEALKLESGDSTLLTGRALTLIELEEYDHARVDLTRAIRREGETAELLGLRGEVYMRMGQLEEAAEDLRAAAEQAPDEPEYALTLARLLLVRGNVEQALKVVDGAVDEGGEFAFEAILLRSHLYLLAGQGDQARTDAIRASNLFPDEAFSFVQLAHVQLTEGKLGLAEKAAERAVLLDPSLSDAYLVRGASRQMGGDAEGAKEDFERASRAQAELPLFLLGPAAELVEGSPLGFDKSILEMLSGVGGEGQGFGGFDPAAFAQAFGQGGAGAGPAGMPGMNPMNMLDRIFDEGGNIRGPLKPFFEMAFKNAPKIMENLPPGMLAGVDKEELEQFDFSEMSSEEIEDRMRQFYQIMKSGNGPFGPDDDDDSDDSNGSGT